VGTFSGQLRRRKGEQVGQDELVKAKEELGRQN
jgi:hypothetical protein